MVCSLIHELCERSVNLTVRGWGFPHYIMRLRQRCHWVLPLMGLCSLHHKVAPEVSQSLTLHEVLLMTSRGVRQRCHQSYLWGGWGGFAHYIMRCAPEMSVLPLVRSCYLHHRVCARGVSLTQGVRQRCQSYLWWGFTHYPESCVPGHGVRQLPTFDCLLLHEQPALALDLSLISTWFVRYSMESVSKVSVSS